MMGLSASFLPVIDMLDGLRASWALMGERAALALAAGLAPALFEKTTGLVILGLTRLLSKSFFTLGLLNAEALNVEINDSLSHFSLGEAKKSWMISFTGDVGRLPLEMDEDDGFLSVLLTLVTVSVTLSSSFKLLLSSNDKYTVDACEFSSSLLLPRRVAAATDSFVSTVNSGFDLTLPSPLISTSIFIPSFLVLSSILTDPFPLATNSSIPNSIPPLSPPSASSSSSASIVQVLLA
mmetsp:Transcript_734/g.1730  ORF Transcript_734/g.1730 Transcript_734/m.1730 type:complete len:237 (+) Transcript_734:1001-1711(+)